VANTTVTITSDEVRTVESTTEAGRVLIPRERLDAALGWSLEPNGLCRGDVCVPVVKSDLLFSEASGELDLAAVASALGRLAVVDAEAGLAAVSLASEQRRQALEGLRAPTFSLPDLEGVVHSLEEWRGSKKLLVAFASW
jgi:hypothetical protein